MRRQTGRGVSPPGPSLPCLLSAAGVQRPSARVARDVAIACGPRRRAGVYSQKTSKICTASTAPSLTELLGLSIALNRTFIWSVRVM